MQFIGSNSSSQERNGVCRKEMQSVGNKCSALEPDAVHRKEMEFVRNKCSSRWKFKLEYTPIKYYTQRELPAFCVCT